MNDAGTTVTLKTWVRYYAFSSLSALDFTTFIGTGTFDDPIGAQSFITTCQKHGLLNAGTPDALDSFEFTFNVDPLHTPLPCGITWVRHILGKSADDPDLSQLKRFELMGSS